MAELPPHDADVLYRAAVATEAGQPASTPQVEEIARTLRRLTGVLLRRPRQGRVQITLEYDGDKPPTIRPWRGIWTELD